MGYKSNMLACFSLALVFYILIPQISATPPPTLAISSNPVSYGQNDKITATAPFGMSGMDSVIIYINNLLVSGPKGSSTNYTVCNNGKCLTPGTYAVEAHDNTSGESVVESLTVTPVAPTFSIRYSNITYGEIDTITAYPAFYNDTMEIKIDRALTGSSSRGVFVYNICGNASKEEPCMSAGTHNLTVFDSSENVSAASNETITVSPVLPKLNIQYTTVKYGNADNITATAPVKTDQIYLFLNSSLIASGTGSVSYLICKAPGQSCKAPATYSVYADDRSEGANSSVKQLEVTSSLPTVSVSSQQVPYGVSDKINAVAANPNDNIAIYIDGKMVESGTGNSSYTICSALVNTPCLPAGEHTVSAYDNVEALYTSNAMINIARVLPNISVSSLSIDPGVSDKVSGTAAYYKDRVSVLINGMEVANGTGTVTYVICGSTSSSCLSPGVYGVTIDDIPEGVNSLIENVSVLSPGGASGSQTSVLSTTVSTTTIAPSNATSNSTAKKTASSNNGAAGAGTMNYLELVLGVVAVIVVIALVGKKLLSGRSGPPVGASPPQAAS